ncbi:hypothetical protein [Rubrivivax rivuli]|uniref:Copper resistance protein CopC n=1 Tax=Rubrivivax rivuli TaxID=1862385 RepID=A0A437RAX6_9BURK|nr:hypothetical protein [Rubrivivax rivuli]RVU43872.1 hypothetical protein EOE66_19645 [Rubrivivax rivuli]
MKMTSPSRRTPHPLAALALMLPLALPPASWAGPGAHGPNGEHLDAPTTVLAAAALPRLEAKSETFELVAELRATELVVLVDRYETNEPVLGARLEVESGGVKAVAAFRPEEGDYAVTDAALLKALAAPGEHGLVFTLVAGSESDLLDGTLAAAAGGTGTASAHGHDDHVHGHGLERAAWAGGGIAALGLLGSLAWWRWRRHTAAQPKGAL